METRAKTAQSWRFGVFEVDARNMELRRAARRSSCESNRSAFWFFFSNMPVSSSPAKTCAGSCGLQTPLSISITA